MKLYFMRWAVFLLMFIFNAYSGLKMEGTSGMPCVGDFELSEYILCPTLSTTFPFLTILSPADASNSSSKKHKLIIKNRNNSASYIASNGEIHSVYLEQALVMLRKEYPNASDM